MHKIIPILLQEWFHWSNCIFTYCHRSYSSEGLLNQIAIIKEWYLWVRYGYVHYSPSKIYRLSQEGPQEWSQVDCPLQIYSLELQHACKDIYYSGSFPPRRSLRNRFRQAAWFHILLPLSPAEEIIWEYPLHLCDWFDVYHTASPLLNRLLLEWFPQGLGSELLRDQVLSNRGSGSLLVYQW